MWNEIGLFVNQRDGSEYVVRQKTFEVLYGADWQNVKSFEKKVEDIPEERKLRTDTLYETQCGQQLEVVQSSPLVLKFLNSEDTLTSKTY